METLTQSRTQSWLSWFFRGLIILGFLGLLARLIDLQVIRGNYFRALAEGNRVRRVPIVASRGNIVARGGEVLVGSSEVKKRVIFDPLEGYGKTTDIADAAEEDIITEYNRHYPVGSAFAHVGGYVGSVNEEEVGKANAECLDRGERKAYSFVGRTGLEKQYECLLSGRDGEELVEVDSLGNRIRTLGRRDAQTGQDLRTTIDFNLQTYIADILGGKKEFSRGDIPEGELTAAVVVTDTKGEVLALYSSPSYDPNVLVDPEHASEVASILNDKRMVMFNRAIGGVYHPGSVFKPMVTIAALMSESIDPDYTYNDTGSIIVNSDYGTFTYNNWYFTQYGGTEGEVGIERALARSTDTFYYKIGEMTGMESLNAWTEKFGLGLPTQIDIPGEVSGLVPNPEWKRLAQGERWFLGNTYHFSIGQSDIVLTPLQINQAISVFASGGKLCRPFIAQGTEESCIDLEIDERYMQDVIEGMHQACSAGGTGFTFFPVNNPEDSTFIDKRVACKTGTAETGKGDTTHAWFVFFTPFNDIKSDNESGVRNSERQTVAKTTPDIVVTVLVEEGGEGSKIAGPIARAIYDKWYGLENGVKAIAPAEAPVGVE